MNTTRTVKYWIIKINNTIGHERLRLEETHGKLELHNLKSCSSVVFDESHEARYLEVINYFEGYLQGIKDAQEEG